MPGVLLFERIQNRGEHHELGPERCEACFSRDVCMHPLYPSTRQTCTRDLSSSASGSKTYNRPRSRSKAAAPR